MAVYKSAATLEHGNYVSYSVGGYLKRTAQILDNPAPSGAKEGHVRLNLKALECIRHYEVPADSEFLVYEENDPEVEAFNKAWRL